MGHLQEHLELLIPHYRQVMKPKDSGEAITVAEAAVVVVVVVVFVMK